MEIGEGSEEQLTRCATAVLCTLEASRSSPLRAQDLPRLIASLQEELQGVRNVTHFGSTIRAMKVRYSLRDGWNVPLLPNALTLALAMGCIEIQAGGLLVLTTTGRDVVAAASLAARERLALDRVVGAPLRLV